MALKDTIANINQQLSHCKVCIHRNNLYVRGTFPPKLGELVPKQRRLNLQLPAEDKSIPSLMLKAFEINEDLSNGTFLWQKYDVKSREKAQQIVNNQEQQLQLKQLCGYWIAEQERRYWTKHERNARKEKTWKNMYHAFLKLLDPEAPLGAEYLCQIIEEQSEPASRKRQQMGNCYCRLLKMADAASSETYRVRDMCGGYKGRPFDAKRIPSDKGLLEIFHGFRRQDWQWAYGIMLAYGIRPSEIVVLDLSQIHEAPYKLIVRRENKTKKQREVLPVLKHWPKELDLINPKPPKINVRTNQEANWRVSKAFKRQNVTIQPTVLRDAYAIRCLMNEVPSEIASQWMGHSRVIHDERYLDAIQYNHQLAAHNQMKNEMI